MPALFRILLAICLLATAMPAPIAQAAAAADAVAHTSAPPCHGGEGPREAGPQDAPVARDCCSGGSACCTDGCDCLHAAALPVSLAPAPPAPVPQGPPASASGGLPPAHLAPPVRPPIA